MDAFQISFISSLDSYIQHLCEIKLLPNNLQGFLSIKYN